MWRFQTISKATWRACAGVSALGSIRPPPGSAATTWLIAVRSSAKLGGEPSLGMLTTGLFVNDSVRGSTSGI